jgi:hypothetical protein
MSAIAVFHHRRELEYILVNARKHAQPHNTCNILNITGALEEFLQQGRGTTG